MYIAISAQYQGGGFKGSVRNLANYLEKENEGKTPEEQEYFFNQTEDSVQLEEVVREIDGNTAKLGKDDPKFYSMVVSPTQREIKQIGNDPEKLREYTRELMKAYADSFNREPKKTVDDIKYYAKIEHERFYKETDKKIQENQPYANKILELKNEIRQIERGEQKGNVDRLKLRIAKLEREAPYQQNGKRIVNGMKKEGHQTHIHIIVSRRDMTNSYSLSPGSKYKASETELNGKDIKRGFDRDKFFKTAEKTFDKKFGYDRNFVESYRGKNLFVKDPKKFFAIMAGLSTSQKQVAFKLLHKSGIHIPNIPTNKAQLAFKAFKKLKRVIEKGISSGGIEI
ncbi:MobB family relaxase [Flagellimonas onchidii]|uniref:MobB family relaxase n=1 Tax=Flagellimonas onchidii TaxID=2562684 RepID=UPI0010A6182D|nr:MobB family relaxase [Allomuricauda onchidii]